MKLLNPNPRTIVSMHGTQQQKYYHISHATIPILSYCPIPILILTYLIGLLRIPPLPVLSSIPRILARPILLQPRRACIHFLFSSWLHFHEFINEFRQQRSSYCSYIDSQILLSLTMGSISLKEHQFKAKEGEEIGDYIIIIIRP